MKCKWMHGDEVCCNGWCPYCADWCPVTAAPEICKYFEESEEKIDEQGTG